MKKRFIATLLVGAVAVSSAVGLSACGTKSVGLPKGVQVDEEGWKNAFSYETMNKLVNYTLESSGSSNASIKGKLIDEDGTYEFDASVKANSYAITLYNETDGYAYSESTSSESAKGTAKDTKLNITDKVKVSGDYTTKYYYEYDAGLEIYWGASYTKSSGSMNSSESGKYNGKSENYWNASEDYSLPNDYSDLSYVLRGRFYDKKDIENAESGSLSNLYEKFTYSDGVYTATLYKLLDTDIDEMFDDIYVRIPVAYTVKVCIDSNGYVVGYSEKANESGTYNNVKDGEGIDCTYTIKYELTYAVTNIGNTNPTTKADKKIKDAIQKAKDEVANLEK